MLPLILCIVFMGLGAVSVTLFLIEKIRQYSVKATILKTITSLLFIATCAVGLYVHERHPLSLFVMLGLLLGLLGDIWLDLKYVFKEKDVSFTYAGFAAFGFGHILYMCGMISEYYQGENPLYIIIPILAGVLVGALTILLEKPMKLHYGKMKWIAFVYAILLFSMFAMALSLTILTKFESTTLIMLTSGGVLFAVSDLILSGTYFGKGKERPVDIISNTVTYYAAQFVIAFSMFFI